MCVGRKTVLVVLLILPNQASLGIPAEAHEGVAAIHSTVAGADLGGTLSLLQQTTSLDERVEGVSNFPLSPSDLLLGGWYTYPSEKSLSESQLG